MTVLVCLDDRNGMQFNGRRQSRDRVVSAHLLGGQRRCFVCGALVSDAVSAGDGSGRDRERPGGYAGGKRLLCGDAAHEPGSAPDTPSDCLSMESGLSC